MHDKGTIRSILSQFTDKIDEAADIDSFIEFTATRILGDYDLADVFETPWSDHVARVGDKFSVVRVIEAPDNDHDAETLPMFQIRFEDGTEIEAWPEEVLASRWSGFPVGRRERDEQPA